MLEQESAILWIVVFVYEEYLPPSKLNPPLQWLFGFGVWVSWFNFLYSLGSVSLRWPYA